MHINCDSPLLFINKGEITILVLKQSVLKLKYILKGREVIKIIYILVDLLQKSKVHNNRQSEWKINLQK